MLFASWLRTEVAIGEKIADAAIDTVFNTATAAVNTALAPLPKTRAAALKLLGDARSNLIKLVDDTGTDLGDSAAGLVEDVTEIFAFRASRLTTPEDIEKLAAAAIGQLQTISAQAYAGIKPSKK